MGTPFGSIEVGSLSREWVGRDAVGQRETLSTVDLRNERARGELHDVHVVRRGIRDEEQAVLIVKRIVEVVRSAGDRDRLADRGVRCRDDVDARELIAGHEIALLVELEAAGEADRGAERRGRAARESALILEQNSGAGVRVVAGQEDVALTVYGYALVVEAGVAGVVWRIAALRVFHHSGTRGAVVGNINIACVVGRNVDR